MGTNRTSKVDAAIDEVGRHESAEYSRQIAEQAARVFAPEWIAAALAFKARWPADRCKRRDFADWREALQSAWYHGWDDREPDGAMLRQLRNNYGYEWLNRQGAK